MAKPLEFTPRPASPQQRLENEFHDSAPALEESLRLLRELHEHGVLDVLTKLVRGGEGLTEGALRTLGSDQMIAGLRSVVELARLIGGLDPADIRQLAQGIGGAVSQGAHSAVNGEKVTPLELPRLLLDPDVQLALGTLFGVLRGLGQGIRAAREEQANAQPGTRIP
ncbi:DUF1641 domain-containing protein [Deinococcus sp.]|uniref:DUF1641 domain-containing protein n=1 Tax=Deinococcus sp. TaxID=47478 RepID=UPI0025C3DCB4|nr:DUF1641 domain-containing protein [Deinococcus sp.]